MDFDRTSDNSFGSDGCFESDMIPNAGLPSIWCEGCLLTLLYEDKYRHLSRADFWIASANAVIRQTSINNALDLKGVFAWGRVDAESCSGSSNRLPAPTGCAQTEAAFITRMGLEWIDAVALMGAHSLGRGSIDFSGHEGVWVANADEAQIFDKRYYEEIYSNSWRPRVGERTQNWTTGPPNSDDPNPRLMLNTDICLVYDIDESVDCCTRTDQFFPDGGTECLTDELASRQCPFYSQSSSRIEAVDAVEEMLGGELPNSNNDPFYNAYTEAWVKATENGWDNLLPLAESCDGQSLFS